MANLEFFLVVLLRLTGLYGTSREDIQLLRLLNAATDIYSWRHLGDDSLILSGLGLPPGQELTSSPDMDALRMRIDFLADRLQKAADHFRRVFQRDSRPLSPGQTLDALGRLCGGDDIQIRSVHFAAKCIFEYLTLHTPPISPQRLRRNVRPLLRNLTTGQV
ncbi:hypothetical protein B0T21DRAFT_345753 [Apiosordaria backusii]|uniref:Uncharacterized protein n=1 Tax=Apiosordaria backusii TaxID=314023 RepID=A0AA40K0Z0_9PEZI|nr:hypothetical protein B0T21DRAFT_345753 [Apiosordaria backusii]